MEYIEEGTYDLDLSKLKIIPIMQRALYNKVYNIDVFINKDKLTVIGEDLSGNVLYILREQDINEDNLKSGGNKSDKVIFDNEVEDIDEDMLNDLFDSDMMDELDLNWEVNSNKKEPDFGISELKDNKNVSFNEMYPEPGEINVNTYDEKDYDADPERKDKEMPIELQGKVCRFSTTSNLLKTLSMFNRVTLDIGPDYIKVISVEDATTINFAKIKSYNDIEKYNSIITEIEWERFPSKSVKSIIPLVDQIESNKLKQKLILKNKQLYIYSDTVAITTNIRKLYDNYLLNSDMLRLMKYAVSKWSEVYIGFHNNGLAFNIDGLIVVYPYANKDIPLNIAELLNEDKYLTDLNIDKKISKVLEIIDAIGGTKIINIEVGTNSGRISTDKTSSLVNLSNKFPFRFSIDLDKLNLARKLSGTKTPDINTYVLNDKIVLMLINEDLKVIIEGNNYLRDEVPQDEDKVNNS